jgi:uncharacterized 2Fe-2S/4Fe-4S cluster protein (DUF4445 family)
VSRRNLITLEQDHGSPVAFTFDAAGRVLSEILSAHGYPLNTRCGQRGLCKGCEVWIEEGSVLVEGTRVAGPAIVRACRANIDGDLLMSVPARSRIEHKPQVGETFEIAVPCGHDPLFKIDGVRDTAFAVDIGTTTVVVLLVDLATGDVLSRAGAFNHQIRFGDNVLTRIDAARTPEAIAAMQSAIVAETLTPLLAEACEKAGRGQERIAGGSIAANTTMLHLLLGMDPTPLGIAPFTPHFLEGKTLTCGEIGLGCGSLAATTPLQLLPGIAAYIGADITAGVFATGMVFDAEPSLLVDIGTNGEIVLQSGGQLTACATAAGPAFEGCGLRSGTRAKEGAISDLEFSADPFTITATRIGSVPPGQASGICGSAYIDFLAGARSCGLLTDSGRFEAAVWDGIADALRCTDDDGKSLRLEDARRPDAPRVSEVDIALLLQAKAAIGAGIETLLEMAGIRAGDISHVYLAGGFGMHLNVPNAIAIGLLPGFRPEQIHVVGNTSLAGALLTVIDRTSLIEMEDIRTRVKVIELNLAGNFEDRYIDHLMLP